MIRVMEGMMVKTRRGEKRREVDRGKNIMMGEDIEIEEGYRDRGEI
jgi:hypothetical protein